MIARPAAIDRLCRNGPELPRLSRNASMASVTSGALGLKWPHSRVDHAAPAVCWYPPGWGSSQVLDQHALSGAVAGLFVEPPRAG